MAAFSEDYWRLQADLQKEYGWSISIRDQTLYVNGPPFAWMKLPAWSLPHCAVSGGQEIIIQRYEKGREIRY